MKLRVLKKSTDDGRVAIKQSVVTSVLSYAKSYELLHKQIWRKARYRITVATLDVFPFFNGRSVGFIRKWNIKSGATSAYSYNGADNTFGLNQLFVGQDFRKTYIGSPKSGIYHDDCYIVPKSINTTATFGHINAWIYYFNTENTKEYNNNYLYYREQNDGEVLISNVYIDYYTVDSIYFRRIVIEHVSGEVSYVELGSYIPSVFLGEGIEYGACSSSKSVFGYKNWYRINESFSEHGEILAQYETDAIHFSDSRTLWTPDGTGWIRVYQDGTVIQFEPEYSSGEDYYSPTYAILPMVYLDTGDLVMDKIEFVDKWDDYFELVVHEDGGFWAGIIKFVAIIIVAIITYFTWGATSGLLAAVVAIGGALTIVGIMTDNQNLMLIGSVMMLIGGIGSLISSTTSAIVSAAELSVTSTSEVLVGSSLEATFAGYPSAAGMENLVAMTAVETSTTGGIALSDVYFGAQINATTAIPYATSFTAYTTAMETSLSATLTSSALSSAQFADQLSLFKDFGGKGFDLYNNVSSLSSSTSSTSSTREEDSGIKLSFFKENDIFDPEQYIKNVIAI